MLARIPVNVRGTALDALMADNTGPICNLAVAGDKEPATEVFELALLQLLAFMGVDWNGIQISEATEAMYREAYWLTFSELKLFMEKAKAAHFGTIYGGNHRFSPFVLMEWLQIYRGQIEEHRDTRDRVMATKFATGDTALPRLSLDTSATEERTVDVLAALQQVRDEVQAELDEKAAADKAKRSEEWENYKKRLLKGEVPEIDTIVNEERKKKGKDPLPGFEDLPTAGKFIILSTTLLRHLQKWVEAGAVSTEYPGECPLFYCRRGVVTIDGAVSNIAVHDYQEFHTVSVTSGQFHTLLRVLEAVPQQPVTISVDGDNIGVSTLSL